VFALSRAAQYGKCNDCSYLIVSDCSVFAIEYLLQRHVNQIVFIVAVFYVSSSILDLKD
jgi:hypothetical protein